MKRQPPPSAAYGDPNMNPYVGAGQRMRMNNYEEAADHHLYKSSSSAAGTPPASKLEGQRQWDRDSQTTLPNQNPSSHSYNEGPGGNGARSYYQGRAPEPKLGLENQVNKEARTQPHEQDMEIGYEDNNVPLSFDGLERKFLDEVMKLVREQSDAEDEENARHSEKIIEINSRYQEKLSALRAQQANRREEYLQKESQARFSQYQQAGISHYPNTGLQDACGYGGPTVAREARRAYATNEYESYRDRSQFIGGGRSQGAEGRISYPEGRVYNNARGRYY